MIKFTYLLFFPSKCNKSGRTLRSVHTVVHEAILPRTFVRVRPSQTSTRAKVRVRVRVRRPPTMLDFCTSYTCTTYKCTSLLYSNELIIISGFSNQMVFLQDITL